MKATSSRASTSPHGSVPPLHLPNCPRLLTIGQTDAKAIVNIVEEFGLDLWAEHVRYPGRVDVMVRPPAISQQILRVMGAGVLDAWA